VVRRITARLVVITLAAIALSYALLSYQVYYAADRLSEGSLIEEANEIARGLSLGRDGVTLKVPRGMRSEPAIENGDFRYSVTDSNRNVLFSSQWPPTSLNEVSIADTKHNLYLTSHQQPNPTEFFGALVHASIAGKDFIILAESNSRNFDTITDTLVEEFFLHGAWVYVALLLGLLVVSIFTISATIRPVERLSAQAAKIGPQSTNLRLSEAQVPREILGFVQAVNSALDRLEAGFQVQREFTADAAHELRTPLAVLRAHIDTVSDKGIADELRHDVDAMTHIVAQLLRIARLDAMVVDPREGSDLSEIVIAVASALIPSALKKGKRLEVHGVDVPVRVVGNADLVLHSVRNLVDNAIAYSGTAKTIEIVVGEDCTIRVIDRGPGVPAYLAGHVFRRFWRSDRSGEGAGLGLSIVKRSMELCGGRVTLAETPGGGATFILAFRPRQEHQNAPVSDNRLRGPSLTLASRHSSGCGGLVEPDD
jgi:signal transduction histidine kinase